jgi:hypothetical protein
MRNMQQNSETLKPDFFLKRNQNRPTVANPCKETYALAPIATDSQLTTLQSDQLHFFYLHIIRQSSKEVNRTVDNLPEF